METANISYLIGIDGGGTGCRAAIAMPDGRVIGTAKGGSANPGNDFDGAIGNIRSAISAATADANLPESIFKSARLYGGFAGVHDDITARKVAGMLPVPNASIGEDRETNIVGALAGRDGSLAAIGTGSFFARHAKGGTQYIGGWGFALGDQASGAWLGKQLLVQTLLCFEDIAPHSPLTLQTLKSFQGDPRAITTFAHAASPAEFGQFSRAVVTAAKENDLTGYQLVQDGVAYIVNALTTLGYQPGETLCLTGGLGAQYKDFLPCAFANSVVPPEGDAVQGALKLAAQIAAPT